MNYKLSIVIPVYNNFKFTNSVLKWFKNRNDFEIIIVNNASTDNTKTELENMKLSMDNLISIHNEINIGFGGAVNLGISKAKSDYVLILNNDIMIATSSDSWLLSLISNDALVGPTGGFLDNNLNFKYETENPNDKINYMSGWCLCAHKMIWNKLILPECSGPFDNKTYFCYFEDTDLSFRAAKLGIPFKMVKIPVFHIGKQTSKKLNTTQLFTESKKKFIKKWKK